jgi:hypothetical protein
VLAEVFGGDGVLVLLITLVMYGVSLWALVDACILSRAKWKRAGRSKSLWIIFFVVTLPFAPLGTLVGLCDFALTRPKVIRAIPRAKSDSVN